MEAGVLVKDAGPSSLRRSPGRKGRKRAGGSSTTNRWPSGIPACPRPAVVGLTVRLLGAHVVESPRDGDVATDKDLQVGHVPTDGSARGVEAALADPAHAVDAEILQGLLVLVRNDIVGDVGHQTVEILGRGAVEPVPVYRQPLPLRYIGSVVVPPVTGNEWCSCVTTQRPSSLHRPMVSRRRLSGFA